MSAELELPIQINSMRDKVNDWLDLRPTISTLPEYRIKILRDEMRELESSVTNKLPFKAIKMEVGDVLFAMLAIDSHADQGFDKTYDLISKYSNSLGFNIENLFDKTLTKNVTNYPAAFFNQMSPFSKTKDAIDCLRVMRKFYITPEKLNECWWDLDAEFAFMPFFDGWVATGKFREFIKTTLYKIAKGAGKDSETFTSVAELFKHGVWDMVPLDIPNNKIIWR